MTKTKIKIISLTVLTFIFLTGIIVYASKTNITMIDIVMYSVFGLIGIVTIYRSVNQWDKEEKGLTVEDELSIKISQKASAMSFRLSFIFWTMLLIFSMESKLSIETVIGLGLGCMGLIYITLRFIINKKGIIEE